MPHTDMHLESIIVPRELMKRLERVAEKEMRDSHTLAYGILDEWLRKREKK